MIQIGPRVRWSVLLLATLAVAAPSIGVGPQDDPVKPVLDDSGVPQVRFNFKGQSWDQVLDYFSRATGMPIVRAVEPPAGTVDYFHPSPYPLPKALETLNILLQTRDVMLRQEDGRLVLDDLDESKRVNLPTFVGELPAEVTPDTVVTLIVPLVNATAAGVAEQLKEMVGGYGMLVALPEQNSLLVVETAANVRRLRTIVDELDREDVENAVEQIQLQHAPAGELLPTLEKLMSERIVKTVVQNKKPVQVEEDLMPAGFRITADARTNTIIARGTPRRIERLRAAIAMLDTPRVGSVRAMRTIQLERLTVADARAKLDQLFGGLPEEKRPTYVMLEDSNRITVAAEPGIIDQATQFLADLENGGGGGGPAGADTAALLPLSFAEPDAAIAAVKAVLNQRQISVVRLVPGPDGRSLVVAGPSGDVEAVRRTLVLVDRPAKADRQVRYLVVEAVDPALAVERAREMHDAAVENDPTGLVEVRFDAADRRLVIAGTSEALDAFERALDAASATVEPRTAVRQFTVTATEPSRLVEAIESLAATMLQPRDGGVFVPPVIDAVDALDLLVVQAPLEQFPVIEELVSTLDRPRPGDIAFRAIPVGSSDPDGLLARALGAFDRQAAMLADGDLVRPDVSIDRTVGAFEVLGPAVSVQAFERSLAEARRLLPPPAAGRLLEVRQVRAADIVDDLRRMAATAIEASDGRRLPEPIIEVIEPTNALWVRAEPAQLAAIEAFVVRLDVFEPTDMPPLRMLQLAASDAVQVAALLTSRYDARPTDVRREEPVRIEADAATNTLVVTAADAIYDEIREFVESLNRNSDAESERETMIFPLRLARAVDLAKALGTLYPEPPMPLDSRGRPLPHLRQPREVFVSADAGTNTLIIEAPSARKTSFEELVQQLDRIELPPQAALRTWNVSRGEGQQIATTLQNLAGQGVLSQPGPNGEKAVEVTVQFEPRSRTLIVAGDEFTFGKVEEILDDLQAVPVTRSLRVIDIATGDPEAIAARATRLYIEQTEGDPDFGPVEVEVDAVNGTILAVGEEGSLGRYMQVVAQLESAQASPPDVRFIPLEHVDAVEVVATLDQLLGNELSLAVLGGPKPAIQALPAVNAVLVAAQPREHEIIGSVVRSLDVAEETLPPIRILQVRTADAENLAAALSATYDRRSAEQKTDRPVRITADAATNALIVAAHPELLDEIRTIVEDLNDTDRLDAEGREIRIFALRIARAEELAKTIDEMYPEPPMPVDSRGRPRPDLRQPREVVVRANPQMNALIVDAPIQRMAGFEKLVLELDRAKVVAETEIRTWKLARVELEAAARTLRELAAGGHLGATDVGTAVTVSIDAASDTLIVSGPTAIFERVDSVIRSLQEGPVVPTTTLRTFRLVQARAESLAPMLRDILVARVRESVGGDTVEIDRLLTVSADRKTNTLIISAPEAVMPVAEQLVETLDASASVVGDPTVRVRPLVFADATIVATALQQAIPSMTSDATGDSVDVKVVPAAGSNALLLVGIPEDIDEVETLIEPLDARPATDAVDARTFELAHADATRIAPIVQKLLDDQQDSDPRILIERIRRSRGMIDLTPKVRVEADSRTNSLIVSGPQQTVNLAEGLIEQLDRPDADAERTYASYTPTRLDPAKVVQTATRVLEETRPAGTRSTLELVLEPQSGAITIIGSEDETQRAVALLNSWDQAVPALPGIDLRVVTLQRADAATVASSLTPLLRDRSRWPESLRAAVRAGLPISEPNVTADVAANRVLVSAPAELQPVARALVDELDRIDQSADLDVRVYAVAPGSATEMAAALETTLAAAARPGEPTPVVAAAARADSIIVTASPRLQQVVEAQLVGVESNAGGIQVRTVRLEHASAARLAPLVERMLADKSLLDDRDLPDWMRVGLVRYGIDGGGQSSSGIRVLADTRLNAIVVTGPIAALNAAEQLAHQLDGEDAGRVDRRIRVLAVRNADAAEIGETLDELFATTDDASTPPVIRVNAASNSLLVRADRDQFEQIEAIVRDIDAASMSVARELRTVPVDPGRGSAEDVARMLERLLDREGDDRVKIVPLEELLQRGRTSVETSGAAKAPRRTSDASTTTPRGRGASIRALVAMVALATPLPCQDAVAVETPPAATDVDVEADAESSEEDVPEIVIAIDPATNSLVVLGSPRELDRLADLAGEIEGRLPEEGGVVRTITLPSSVDVRNVANIVNQTLRQLVPAGGKPGDLARRTSVVPDPASNALIVACRERDFALIGELVASTARPADAPSVVVRVFRLAETSADRAAEGLRSLLTRPRGDRFTELAVTLDADGRSVTATFDPSRISVISDVEANALVVMAPADAMPFVDRYVDLVQQGPSAERTTLRLFELRYARAAELQSTLRQIFQTRFRNLRRAGGTASEPDFAVDSRSNQLIVTASAEELAEVERLLDRLDVEDGRERHPLTVLELAAAQPTAAAKILDEAVIGSDEQLRATTLVLPDDQSGVILVRADEPTLVELKDVLGRIDREATSRFPVRTIELERADAGQVSESISRFYADRAKLFSTGRGRRAQSASVAITGTPGGGTLLVACDDETFAEVQDLAKTFDETDADDAYEYRIYELKHARAEELSQSVQELVSELIFSSDIFGGRFGFFGSRRGGGGRERDTRGSIAVRAEQRINALVVTGKGDNFTLVEELIKALDVATPDDERRIVRQYRMAGIDSGLLEDVLREALDADSGGSRWWESQGGNSGATVLQDRGSDTVVVVGTAEQQAEVATIVADLAEGGVAADSEVTIVRTEFADVNEVSTAVERFIRDRARATGIDAKVVVTPVQGGNAMLVAGPAEDVRTVEDLVARIDAPDLTGVRRVEIISIERGQSAEIARLVGAQFQRRGGDGVVITPDARTNSILVNAPAALLPEIQGLIARLDAPDDTDQSVIRTYRLMTADAAAAVTILQETLRLDDEGRTTGISITPKEGDEPVEVRATIVADRRSNSLVVTATPESLPVIEAIVEELEAAPARSPVEYRIVQLDHAPVADVSITLDRLLMARGDDWRDVAIDYNRFENQLVIGATPDQFEVIGDILGEIDVPAVRMRRTDFVALDFADAKQLATALGNFYGPYAFEADTPGKQNVKIIADEATNSLVITAAEAEWEGILALIGKLDAEEYDASLQLEVLPLAYADARSVARAINEAFRPVLEQQKQGGEQGNGNRGGGEGDRGRGEPGEGPTVLAQGDDFVSASAEPQTNALIVSASRRNLLKITRIIEQLDVAEFAKLPPPRIITVASGDPEALAQSLRAMYLPDGERSATLRIVGDRVANAVIVRGDDEEFAQISALAAALQQEADSQGLSVRVVRLESAPAARVAESIRGAFDAKARQERVPFSVQVDATGNALVVASTGPFFEEVQRTVREMDRLAPAAGQGIFLIELENIPASVAERTVRRIGLDRPQDDSANRLVVEPIRMSAVEGRNALLVVANPSDRETIVGLFKAIDADPEIADAEVVVVPLERAKADAVMRLVDQMIDPAGGGPDINPIASALKEQIRRLAIRGENGRPIELDLSKPIRVTADTIGNAVVVSSTPDNARALVEVVRLLDRLPTTEAVTIQIFPLENMSAERFVAIVEELFNEGDRLAIQPGSGLAGMPEGMLGSALLEEVAFAVDERTNTVVAAGKESAIAFVEVMKNRLDSEISTGWVEPKVIVLEHADASDLAELVDEVVVQGQTGLPGATPLQNQVARLRALRDGGIRAVEGDVFVPLSRVLVRAEPAMNALVVVASPPNLAIVEELVAMLDIEAAAPGALVRVFAVEHGSAERIATMATGIIEGQRRARGGRDEDQLIAIPDLRTNSIVVSTSARNFDLFADLLTRLDTEMPLDYQDIRTISLANANASRVAPIVQRMMDARLDRLRRVQPDTADLEKVLVLSDDLANALIVAAGNESMQVVERLMLDLDVDNIGATADIRVVPVNRGGLERIADAIGRVMDRRYAGVPAEVARRERPLVIPDPRTSSLLVAGGPEDRRAIEDLVERLEDTPMNPAIEIEVLALESGSAKELAPRIESLMRDRTESLGDASQPTDRVSIEPLDGSNALVVAASRENQQVVRDLVDLLVDAERDRIGGQSFEIVSVARNRASTLVDLVDEIYADAENRRRGPDSVRVTADDRLNAILVSGTPADVGAVRDLVSRLDSERPGSVVEVRQIPLASANAQETVGLIETVLNGGNVRGRGRNERVGTVMRYLREIEGEEDDQVEIEVSTAIRESIGLTPDVRTNTVIVTAPRESMALIERMIRDLDSSSTGSKKIEVFKLANADADAMAEILTDLFQLRQQGSLYVLKPREGGVVEAPAGVGETALPGGGDELFGTDLTLVPDERQALSITVDSRTNSLIVSGTPKYLELVSQVVTELDAQDANERETLVYNLRNAQADEVARVVSDFVSEDQRKLVETLNSDQLPSAARLLEREVTIVGDAKSNSVLVNASPRYMEQVESIIKELDIDPPQVLIQVILAEITLNENSDYGLTLNEKVGTIPFRSSLEFSSRDFFTQPVTGSFSVGFSDLSLVLSAMQAQGRLQLLSNPSITIANNEDGRIQVGQEVRLPDSTLTTEFGSQSSSVTPEDVGVILEVRPTINPDGFVRMQVRPTLSRLSEQTTEISETFRSPIIDKREAETTVTVKDGETVVLGGLIEERSERRDMKVPFLGDIPVLGALFRSETETRVRTELLIVLTPHVVSSNDDRLLIEETRRRIDDMPLSTELIEQIRRGRLDSQGDGLDAAFESTAERTRKPASAEGKDASAE